ncbi:MAG: hypothetical protein Q9227_001399 [Pyrenula ochraceoflavens]
MSERRSSARIAAQDKSSPTSSPQSKSSPAGTKRKADTSASPAGKGNKRGRKAKEQKSLEETIDPTKTQDTEKTEDNNDEGKPDTEMKDANGTTKSQEEAKDTQAEDVKKAEESAPADTTKDEAGSTNTSKMDDTGKIEPTNSSTLNGPVEKDSAVEPDKREEETPSSILEKGIIYFFFRGRVGIDHPSDPNEIARSYMVLRPLPHGAKLGDGPIGDGENARLLALPKKVLPKSHQDRFMSFVEKAGTTFHDLKENFMKGSDYETKTAGVRHTPPATPVAEGIYAITTTGRESHLAYIMTIPEKITEVQEDIGIRDRGSFVLSLRNPQYQPPAQAALPQGPDFSKEILDEFRSLRWMPLQPKHLNYANAQFLLIGESGGHLGKAVEEQKEDALDEKKESPEEEMEKLEHEDEIRVKHLKGDDSVFADLGLSAKEYPKVQTTW